LEAVVSFAGVTKVFVVEGNRAHSHSVKIGRIRDGLQEILEGVNSGEAVVIAGQSRLTDGATVEIQPTGLPTPIPQPWRRPSSHWRKAIPRIQPSMKVANPPPAGPPSSGEMKGIGLADLCIKRPVFATMISLFLVVLGWFSFKDIGIDQFPNVE